MCPRCKSLTSAATRPRQASGKFGNFTVIRFMRTVAALITPYTPTSSASEKNPSAMSSGAISRPAIRATPSAIHEAQAAKMQKVISPTQTAAMV